MSLGSYADVVLCTRGPVLFTAPHGRPVVRPGAPPGGDGGGSAHTHARERYTSEICVSLARLLRASFAVWSPPCLPGPAPAGPRAPWCPKCGGDPSHGPEQRVREGEEAAGTRKGLLQARSDFFSRPSEGCKGDPSYMPPASREFGRSPWCMAARRFMQSQQLRSSPCMVVDIHGKADRPHDLDIDVGIGAMEALWYSDKRIQPASGSKGATKMSSLDNLKTIVSASLKWALSGHGAVSTAPQAVPGVIVPFGVQCNPKMSGYRGTLSQHTPGATLSHQCVLLGIPAIQLELPYSVRKKVVHSPEFAASIAAALSVTFQRCIEGLMAESNKHSTQGQQQPPTQQKPNMTVGGILRTVHHVNESLILDNLKSLDVLSRTENKPTEECMYPY
ncbi:hypothetical protein Pelo_12798 [Pelomyxa schiedti]|nr:hypothetical protein Pelo_12798 [Pelomyxa schiedti]